MRRPFGGTPDAVVINAATGLPQPGRDEEGVPLIQGDASTARDGGGTVSDLTDLGGDPLPSGTLIPEQTGHLDYLGPDDGTDKLWVGFGGGRRVAMLATDIGDRVGALEAATGASSDTVNVQHLVSAKSPVINVTHPDYGAAGDDSDDTTAIQAALTAAGAHAAAVYVPPGVYGISATLRGYQNLTLILAPGAVLKRKASITMFVNGNPEQNAPGYTGQGNITITGTGTIDMQGVALSGSNNCMSFGHAERVTVQDITILDQPSYHQIEFNAVRTYRVLNVKFKGFVDKSPTGANYYKECIQVDIAKGTPYFPSFGPYDNTCSEDGLVQGCYVGPSGTAGTTAPNCLIGGHSSTVGTRFKSVRVIDNYGEDLSFWPVSLYATSGVHIEGNEFWRCGAGARAETIKTADRDDTIDVYDFQTGASQHERGVTITNNRFYDTIGLPSGHGYPGDVIRVLGEATGKIRGAVITGNIIEGGVGGVRGIRARHVDRAVIDANTVNGTAGYGIWAQDCTNLHIGAANIVEGATGANGVMIAGCTDFTVAGMRIKGCYGEGLHVEASTGGRLAGVLVKNAGQHGIKLFNYVSDVSVENCQVDGASVNAHGVSSAYSVSTTCQQIRLRDNRARHGTSTNLYLYAFDATSSGADFTFDRNTWTDGTAGPGTAKHNLAAITYDAGNDRTLALPGVPGTPAILTATAGHRSANLTWTQPASGGAPITGYQITPSTGAAVEVGPDPAGTITGLTNGTAYTFTIRARNAIGLGAASAASGSVTPALPALPTGAVAWYKASGLALSSGNPVTSWADASGHGYTITQGTGARQPTYVANAVNGNPGVRFDPVAGQYLERTTGLSGLLADAPGYTCLIVYTQHGRATGQAQIAHLISTNVSTGNTRARTGFGSTTGRATPGGRRLDGDALSTVTASTGAPALNTFGVATQVVDYAYANTSAWQNTTRVINAAALTFTPGNTDTTSPLGMRVGCTSTTAADYLDGTLCEMVVYDRALTVPEVAAAQAVLGETYGLF